MRDGSTPKSVTADKVLVTTAKKGSTFQLPAGQSKEGARQALWDTEQPSCRGISARHSSRMQIGRRCWTCSPLWPNRKVKTMPGKKPRRPRY